MQLSIPSKTFLLGEYVALQGGPALIMNTKPCFVFRAEYSEKPPPPPFAKESPAGQYYQDHQETLSHYHIQFDDPHASQGGFGASTAQFIGVYSLVEKGTLTQLHKTYQQYARLPSGVIPSGFDLLGQCIGNLAYIAPEKNTYQALNWPFDDLSCLLVRTHQRLATHEHLASLKTIALDNLALIVEEAYEAIQAYHSEHFIDCVHRYALGLQDAGYVAPHTQTLLKTLAAHPDVLACKGCGAMGAEVIAVLCRRKEKPSIITALNKLSLTVTADAVLPTEPLCV